MSSAPHFLLDHVAVGVPRAEEVAGFVGGTLGGRPVGAGPGPGFRFWQWEFAGGGRLEVLEPDDSPDGFLRRFLEQRGPGLHHVTFKVPVLEDAVERARGAGFRVVGISTDWPAWKEAFLHPRSAQGIVVQLAESHPELEPEDAPSLAFPPAPAAAAPPARLLGLRLSATSGSRARHLWQETLGGDCDEHHGRLRFEWPDSPLRVSVRVDAGRAEGPLGIELSPPAGLALPEEPHPLLGARLLAAD